MDNRMWAVAPREYQKGVKIRVYMTETRAREMAGPDDAVWQYNGGSACPLKRPPQET